MIAGICTDMAAHYLTSALESEAMNVIDLVDRDAADFYVQAPFVIDCRPDTKNFRQQVNERQRAYISAGGRRGSLRFVSELPASAKDYVVEQAVSRFRQLSPNAAKRMRMFLLDWCLEKGRHPHQVSKGQPNFDSGVAIILPGGTQCSYDIAYAKVIDGTMGTPA